MSFSSSYARYVVDGTEEPILMPFESFSNVMFVIELSQKHCLPMYLRLGGIIILFNDLD